MPGGCAVHGRWLRCRTCVCSPCLTGYYRLATAEVELKKYDEAIDTIKAGLKKQPGESTAMLLSCSRR